MSFPKFSELFYVFGKSGLADKALKQYRFSKVNVPRLQVTCSGLLDVFYVPGCESAIHLGYASGYKPVEVQYDEQQNQIDVSYAVSSSDRALSMPVVITAPRLPKLCLNNRVGFYAFDIFNHSVDLTLNDDSTAKLFGRTEHLNIHSASRGEIKARFLISQYADLNIIGSGAAHVSVTRKISSHANDKEKIRNHYYASQPPALTSAFGHAVTQKCTCLNCLIRHKSVTN